jgi:kynurenine formamidase
MVMRSKVRIGGTVVLLVTFFAGWTVSGQQPGAGSKRMQVTKDQVDRWMKELSNWGRWGKDDQLGTVNLITETKRKQAIALARNGTVVSIARQPVIIPKDKPEGTGAHLELRLTHLDAGYTVEDQTIAFHGSTFTHIDGLCHADWDGKIYNGYPLADAVKGNSCLKGSIGNLKAGIVTRGILVDIPRLKGLPFLDPGTQVFTGDIEAWEKMAGVKISPGDAVLLHTGRWTSGKTSGFDVSIAPFLKTRDVAVIGSDGTLDAGQVQGTQPLPLHRFVLVALGMNIIDNADTTLLAETAAKLKRWEFMLVLAPIATPGGTGSPLNPMAIF